MSVRIWDRVWTHSKHSGTELLMLLAIADFADDQGHAYPAVPTLAQKCRMTERNANNLLAKLLASGELEVRRNAGPRGTNRYRITLEASKGMKRTSPPNEAQPLKPTSPLTPEAGFIPPTPEADFTPEAHFTLKPASEGGEAGFRKGVKPTSPEPSLNRQEPSGQPLTRPKQSRTPNCPHEEIVRLYHQQLPDLPRVVLLDTKDRRRKLAEFWAWVLSSSKSDGTRRAETAEQALRWISDYFARARENDFVMGRSGRGPGHENWRCSLDYLLTDKGKTQVIERTEAVAA